MGTRFEVASGAVGEVFWNTPAGVVVCRPREVLAWNPGAEAMLGMTADEATAGADLEPAFGSATGDFWALVDAGAGRATLWCDAGSERVLDATAWRLGGAETAPTVIVLHDVTAERRQLAALQRLNALARELLAEPSLDVLMVRIVDAAKDLVRADFSALLTLREGTEEEVADFVYNAPRELFPERLPRAVGLLAVPIRTKAVTRLDDIRGHPAGVGIPVQHPPIAALVAAPIFMGDRVVGELAVANRPERPAFDDVDEAVISELASHAAIGMSLATAKAAQEQLDASRRAMMDVALANIHTPLAVARGFLATLRDQVGEESPEEREHALDAVERALERVQALAEGAVLEEPIPTASPRRELEILDVVSLLEELAAELSEPTRGVAVETAVEPGTATTFVGERRLVRELLDNLVTNAVKHSEAGQPVTVTVREEGGSLRFDVTDRGPGIPAEERTRVFEQFYRTRQSVADGVPGTGLGLWIARRLAEMQGGSVGVSSREGQGSTFWVTFPLAPLAPQAPAVAAAS